MTEKKYTGLDRILAVKRATEETEEYEYGKLPCRKYKEMREEIMEREDTELPSTITLTRNPGWDNLNKILSHKGTKSYPEKYLTESVGIVAEFLSLEENEEMTEEMYNRGRKRIKDEYGIDLPYSEIIEKNVGWWRALKVAGLKPSKLELPEEELIEIYEDVSEDLGHSPSRSEWTEYRDTHEGKYLPEADTLEGGLGSGIWFRHEDDQSLVHNDEFLKKVFSISY